MLMETNASQGQLIRELINNAQLIRGFAPEIWINSYFLYTTAHIIANKCTI